MPGKPHDQATKNARLLEKDQAVAFIEAQLKHGSKTTPELRSLWEAQGRGRSSFEEGLRDLDRHGKILSSNAGLPHPHSRTKKWALASA